jgi:hypothetical protein
MFRLIRINCEFLNYNPYKMQSKHRHKTVSLIRFSVLSLALLFISASYTDQHKNTAHSPSTGLRTPDGPRFRTCV